MPDTKNSPQGSGKKFMNSTAKKLDAAPEKTATMTVVKEVSGNGKTVKIEEATAVVVEEVVKPVEKVAPVITLDRRIERVEELNITIAKWRGLQAARKGLTNFRLGTDGLSSTLTLKDADGQPFSTSNPVVVEAALAHIRQVLNEKISEAENEINFSV